MKAFDIGLSALRAQQLTLSVLGNNLANASTPGYHRQQVDLANRLPLREGSFSVGTGVDVVNVRRIRSDAVETALIRNSSEAGFSQQTQDIAAQVESLLTPGDSSIHAALSSFFNRLEKVANAPQDSTLRREFLSSASELMKGFSSLDTEFVSVENGVRGNLDNAVKDVNQKISDIAQLNAQIFRLRSSGTSPNDLIDRRDQIASQLSEYIQVDSATLPDGREQTLIAGGAAIIGTEPVAFRVMDYKNGTTGIALQNLSTPITLSSGRIAAMTTALNETIPEFRSRLSELAREIVRNVDQQHAQGMTDHGPYSVLLGSRGVADVSVPLARSNPDFPITNGRLYITVTDATGARRTEEVRIDPNTDSLQDVAAKLSAVAGVTANVDPVAKTLSISALGGNSIDFAGTPDETGILSALGINSLFEGSSPGSFRVRDEILRNPELLATSASGLPGEGKNMAAIASLRDLRSGAFAGRTSTEELADVTAESGLLVQTSEGQNAQLQAFRQRLEADRDAVSGVDINEEMLKMMQSQRAYQAAARYITTTDQMLTELFQMVR